MPTAVPLASLRPSLERGWPPPAFDPARGWRPGARRLPNGRDALADLAQPAGGDVAFRLSAPPGTRVVGTVAVDPEESRVRPARVRLRLRHHGGSRTLWSRLLWRARRGRAPAARQFEVELGAVADAELVLSADADVVWSMPRLLVPELADEAVAMQPVERDGEATAAEGSPDRSEGSDGPLISLLMPVHDPPPEILEEAIRSVVEQTIDDWELCLADDGSQDPEVRTILSDWERREPRVTLRRREQAGGISAATNLALEAASGEYVGLLDHDDTLVPDALERVAELLAERPELDWVYSDEEVVADGERVHAYLKPDWSPDLLRTQMYASHLGVYRRSIARELGFRSDFDGSQDYDFALRFSERTDRIAHIPRVLYSWRAHAGSVAGNPHSKPGAYPAAVRALREHLDRTAPESEIHYGFSPGLYRVQHRIDPDFRVGITVAAEADADGLGVLLDALEDSDAAGLAPERVDVVAPSRLAAVSTEGLDAVVVLDGPALPLTRNWLSRLVGFAVQPGVGAVGAKVIGCSGLVENAGIALSDGTPVPLMSGALAPEPGPLTMALLPSNVTAVAGVLAAPAGPFQEIGGLDSTLGGLAPADFCLRARGDGLRTVLASDTILRRPAGWATMNDLGAFARFKRRWVRFGPDPYFDFSWGWPGSEL